MGSQDAVRVGILGPFCVEVGDVEVPVRSALQRTLLAALAVDCGTVVSTDRLSERVWATDPPRDPGQSLQSQISRIRRRLGEVGGASARQALRTRSSGYALAVDDGQVDAERFEQLAEQAASMQDPREVLAVTDTALTLWRGQPLAEFDRPFAHAEASRLEEVRVGLVAQRVDALLTLGRSRAAVVELEPLLARRPLDEQLHGRLMLALYRCGRQAEALEVFRHLRDRLVSELGVEPSAALRHLERDILQQRPELDAPAEAAETDAARQAGTAGLAARDVTSFVGRERDLATVREALEHAPLVTLTGTGGVGKTRLALRVARQLADRFADGVLVCDLAGVDEQMTSAMATAFGVQPEGGSSLEDALVDSLRPLEVLLLVDNCEHLVGPVAALLEQLLRAAPQARILATSRCPLGSSGEQVVPVAPLSVDPRLGPGPGPAVELFLERARAAAPGARLSEHTDEVRRLCQHLDGLPLSIELAATRMRSLAPADLVERLDRRFELLTAGSAADPRHRSLRAVLEVSYELLSAPARRLSDRLCVFAGGFTLDAAEAICADESRPEDDVAAALAELVDHSLVTREHVGSHARYRVLETVRLYGVSRLGDELSVWKQRHADHYADLARQAEAGIRTDQVARWVESIDAEFANLRAAHRWAITTEDVDAALRLPVRLHHYAYFRLRDEVFRWAEQAIALPAAAASPVYPMALAVAGSGCAHRGELDRAAQLGSTASRLAAADDHAVRLRAGAVLGDVAIYRRQLEELEDLGRQELQLARTADRPYDEAFGHVHATFAAALSGDLGRALTHVADGACLADRLGNVDQRASFLFLDGYARLEADPEKARPALQAAIDLADPAGNRFIVSIARISQASLQGPHGDVAGTLRLFRTQIDLWRRIGLSTHQWATLRSLLELLVRLGRREEALVLHGAIQRARERDVAYGADAEQRAKSLAAVQVGAPPEVSTDDEARGRAMDEETTVAWALATVDRLLDDRDPQTGPWQPVADRGPSPPR